MTPGYFLPASGGTPNQAAYASSFKWYRAKFEGDRNFTLKTFRHSFATNAAQTLDIKTLQYILGHADASTTLNIYATITQNQLESARKKLQDLHNY